MIGIGSKWQDKDGGVYEVLHKEEIRILHNGIGVGREVIAYKDQFGEIYIKAEKEFLQEFKPYEPIYEYQWLIRRKGEKLWSGIWPYRTEEKAREILDCKYEMLCLEFTKREIIV